MILDFKAVLIIAMLTLVVKSKNCNSIDTTFLNNDTIIEELKCYETGNKKYLRSKKNGKIHGKCKAWYPNGQLIYITQYKNGKPDDLHRGWDSTGFLSLEKNYDNGKPIGEHKQYYGKDKPKRFTRYNNKGEKHGWEVFWYDNGNVKDSIFFQNDSTFKRKTFYYNGKIAIREKDIYSSYDAVSYAPEGKKTGFIENGNGEIFVCDSVGKNCKSLKFKNGKQVFK